MRTVIERIDIAPYRRVIAISDIHGHIDRLRALLAKVNLTQDDLLVLVGDLTEKGPHSLDTLRYLLDLRRRFTVRGVMGNVDVTNALCAYDESAEGQALFRDFLLSRRGSFGNSLYLEMLAELGMDFDPEGDMLPYMRAIRTHFAQELGYLASLPTVLAAPGYFFVHAALPTEDLDALARCDARDCLRADAFAERDVRFDNYVIVGHWPVSLYCHTVTCLNPRIDRQRRIVCIDGGNVLKEDGQLNALILPDRPGGEFTFVACDGLPTAVALDAQPAGDDPFTMTWMDNRAQILSEENGLMRVRHQRTGRVLDIPVGFLYERGDPARFQDFTNYRPAIDPGDVLSVMPGSPTPLGWRVKKQGVSGWYQGRLRFLNE